MYIPNKQQSHWQIHINWSIYAISYFFTQYSRIMAKVAIVELNRNCANTVEEIVKMERKIFPKHESLASFFHDELRKKNSGLLYLHVDGELVGYVMYSWPSSLYGSITKLAGSNPTSFSCLVLSHGIMVAFKISNFVFPMLNFMQAL